MAGTAARRTLIKLVGAGTVSAALTAFGTQPANARTASDPQQTSGATDTSAIPRVGILTTNATALVQEGTLTAQWVTEYTNVRQLVVDGTRIGIVTTGNVALVKEGELSAAWSTVATGVKQLAISGNRIGILTTAGVAYIKEGSLFASWVHEHDGVTQLALDGTRVSSPTTPHTSRKATSAPHGYTNSTTSPS